MHLWIETHDILLFFVAVLYSYQMGYMVYVVLHDAREKFRRKKALPMEQPVQAHRFTALISARNEENVIGQLLDTINSQNYPAEMRHAIVIADNCTDRTAEVARAHGATVYERFDLNKIGKGYALN